MYYLHINQTHELINQENHTTPPIIITDDRSHKNKVIISSIYCFILSLYFIIH